MSTTTKLEKKIEYEMKLCLSYGWRQHPVYNEHQQCDICMDDLYGKYVLETACHHRYDLDCIMVTLTDFGYRKCPTCLKEYRKQTLTT